MAFALYDNTALHNAPTFPVALDLASVASVCSADEQVHWLTLSTLVEDAVQAQADEIHLEPDTDCLRLRMRSPFSFNEIRIANPAEYMASLALLETYLWSEVARGTARRAWFSYTLQSGPRLLQLDIVPTSRGDTYLITLLHQLKSPPARIDELAMNRSQQNQLRHILKGKSGLLLLACDHPQARARTARAIAQELVAPDRKIACADIPGHPLLPRVTQVAMDNVAAPAQQQLWPAICELGCDAIVNWHTGSDQMVQQLVRQASTCSLVVQGLEVNSAAQAVDQLLTRGVRSEAIASSLSAVVIQRQLQCLCPYCRVPQAPDDQGTAWLAEYSPIRAGNINDWLRHRMRSSFSVAEGCDRCHQSGRGNTLDLYAIVTLDEDITDALYKGDIRIALNRLRQINPMTRDLMRLAQEGIIALAEARRIAPAQA
ncbi:MAG: hypothetical protein HKN42_01515 [Granulosicoccus sp.]|nr:hypothetical protein [Granulosicoccus sp.]